MSTDDTSITVVATVTLSMTRWNGVYDDPTLSHRDTTSTIVDSRMSTVTSYSCTVIDAKGILLEVDTLILTDTDEILDAMVTVSPED